MNMKKINSDETFLLRSNASVAHGLHLKGKDMYGHMWKLKGHNNNENVQENVCDTCELSITGDMVSVVGKQFHLHCFQCFACRSTFSPGKRVTFWKDQFFCGKCFSSTKDISDGTGGSKLKAFSDSLKGKSVNNKNKTSRIRNTVNHVRGDPESEFGQELARRLAVQYDACEKHITEGKPSEHQTTPRTQEAHAQSKHQELSRTEPEIVSNHKSDADKQSDSLSSQEGEHRRYILKNTKAYSTRSIGKVASIIKLIEDRVEQEIADKARQDNDLDCMVQQNEPPSGFIQQAYERTTKIDPDERPRVQGKHPKTIRPLGEQIQNGTTTGAVGNVSSPATPMLKAWPPVRPSPIIPALRKNKYKPTPLVEIRHSRGVHPRLVDTEPCAREMERIPLVKDADTDEMLAQDQSTLVERLLQRTTSDKLATPTEEASPMVQAVRRNDQKLMRKRPVSLNRRANKTSVVYLRRLHLTSTPHLRARAARRTKSILMTNGFSDMEPIKKKEGVRKAPPKATTQSILIRIAVATLSFVILMCGLVWLAENQREIDEHQPRRPSIPRTHFMPPPQEDVYNTNGVRM